MSSPAFNVSFPLTQPATNLLQCDPMQQIVQDFATFWMPSIGTLSITALNSWGWSIWSYVPSLLQLSFPPGAYAQELPSLHTGTDCYNKIVQEYPDIGAETEDNVKVICENRISRFDLGTRVNDKQLAAISAAIAQNTALTTISLDQACAHISADGIQPFITALTINRNISALYLSQCQLTAPATTSFLRSFACFNIQNFSMSLSAFQGGSAYVFPESASEVFAQVLAGPSFPLSALALKRTLLSSNTLSDISQGLALNHCVTYLDLNTQGDIDFSTKSIQDLAHAIIQAQTIEHLVVQCNDAMLSLLQRNYPYYLFIHCTEASPVIINPQGPKPPRNQSCNPHQNQICPIPSKHNKTNAHGNKHAIIIGASVAGAAVFGIVSMVAAKHLKKKHQAEGRYQEIQA